MEANNSTVDSLLAVNKLQYGMPPSVSVATARRMIQVHPQTATTQAGQTIIFTVQSGDNFVYGPKSYLRIQLNNFVGGLLPADKAIAGLGSLFDRITVSSRSGVELCALRATDVYMSKITNWFMDNAVRLRHEHPMYLDEVLLGTPVPPLVDTQDYVGAFPLHLIPFFSQDRLLPPEIMEGMIIRFDLRPAPMVFHASLVANEVKSFDITSRLMLDATTLADQYRRAVAQIASQDGLILIHTEKFHSQENTAGTGINYDIKKSCSKATGVMICSRQSAGLGTSTTNQQASEPYDFSSIQLQIGSSYMPQTPLIQSANGDYTSREAYYYIQNQIGHFDNEGQYDQFHALVAQTATHNSRCNAIFYQDLTDSNNAMSGLVLNGSRALLVNATMGVGVARRIDTWLSHLRMVRAYSNNVVVRD